MSTNDLSSPVAIDGEELLSALERVPSTARQYSLFDTSDPGAMEAMIRILVWAGYRLNLFHGVEMIESSVYQLQFGPGAVYPSMDHTPSWVKLRFLTDGWSGSGRPLALAYYARGGITPYLGSYPVAHGTESPEATKMVYHFEHEYPGVSYFWVPIFGETWQPLR